MEKLIGGPKTYAKVSTLGGTVIEVIMGGKQIIFPEMEITGGKKRGGILTCFPFFGVPKPEFASDISRHGWLRNQELEVIKEGPARISLAGTNAGLGLKSFPWELNYVISVSIDPDFGFMLTLMLERPRDGRGRAPINPAFHPYLSNLGKRIAMVGRRYIESFPEKAERTPFAGEFENKVFLGQAEVGMVLSGYFDHESFLYCWSDDSRYFCVEPVYGDPNKYNTPEGRYIEEGGELTFMMGLFM